MNFLQRLINSMDCAVTGIIRALKDELNMKIHFLLAGTVLFLGLFYDLAKAELLILFLTITLVIFAEMVNTAIEELGNLISDSYNPGIKKAKDIAAGAVLVTALNAVVVGYIIFFSEFKTLTLDFLQRMQQVPIHLTFIALLLVLLIVVSSKAYFNRGSYLQGGMPSGHTAVAFLLMIVISLLSGDALVASLALLMAVLVAQSRIEGNIHTLLEVIFGAALGFLVGLLVFQFIYF